MKKPNLQRLAQRSKIYLRKASPTILSGLGAAGVIVTSVLAVRATPKALRKIRADSKTNHDGDPEAYSKLEAVKSAWVCYIPAAISGTATIFCIFGANVLNKRQQAALTSAYALLNDSYNNYKDKLKELYGEEAHQKIVDAIAAEKAKDVYITSTGLVRNSSLDFDEHDPNDERLFYDAYSNRYFESSINRVIQAEYHLNRDFVISGYLPANHFYQLLGLEPLEGGDINQAMILLLTLPLEVLMDHYWPKSYAKRIPEFTEYVLKYYEKWQNDELDMDKLKEDLWVYGGVRLEEVEGK